MLYLSFIPTLNHKFQITYSSIITSKAMNIYSNGNTKTVCLLFGRGGVLLGKQY